MSESPEMLPTVADCSFAQFIYPFAVCDQLLLQCESWRQQFDTWREKILGTYYGNLTVWREDSFNSAGLLPHVRDYLNPPSNRHATAMLWSLDGNFLQSPHGLGGGGNRDISWSLSVPAKTSDGGKIKHLPFQLRGIQLSLFESGVGFLTIQAIPLSQCVSDWHDFVHFFRFIGERKAVRIQGRKESLVRGRLGPGHEQDSPFFPACAGGLAKYPDGQGPFNEIVQSLLKMSGPIEDVYWWRDVHVPGQVIPYIALFIDGAKSDADPEIIERSRRFFNHRQHLVAEPSASSLTNHRGTWRYVERSWLCASLDGTAFVALDAPETLFFRQTLPDHLKTQYFLLMQLAWQQRATLLMLARLLADAWHAPCLAHETSRAYRARRIDKLAQMHDLLLSFMARGRFTQVAPEDNHHTAFCRWCDALEVDRLFHDVRDQISHLHEYLNQQKTDELSARVADNVKQVAHVQRAIHLLEIVIFPIYIVELWAHLHVREHSASQAHEQEAGATNSAHSPLAHFNLELAAVFILAFLGTFVVIHWEWVVSLIQRRQHDVPTTATQAENQTKTA